jgi:Methane oxygenase PmoA
MAQEPSITAAGDDLLELRLGDRVVGSYHYGPELARPYLAPLLTAAGDPVTAEPGPPDHPHHRGVWGGHRDVGGVDHWTEFAGHGRIMHRGLALDGASVTQQLDWLDGHGRAMLVEQRVLRLRPGPTLDLTIRLRAPVPVTLGANKDASLAAARVAPAMTRIGDAEGRRGEEACWGRRAAWAGFSGPGRGLAVLDHPANPRHPTPWHVRAYGLLAPNPFLHEPMELGEASFRYRLVVHDGTAPIAQRFAAYAAER